jgi:hypothetical protein
MKGKNIHHIEGHVAETAKVDYRLSFADQGKQSSFSYIQYILKWQHIYRYIYLYIVYISISIAIYLYLYLYLYLYWYICL